MAMTEQEHMLILLLLLKQQQSIKILINTLKARGILEGDDAQAFEYSQLQDAPNNAALFDQLKSQYLLIAKAAGVETGLERVPELPVDWFRPQPPPPKD